MPGVSDQDAQGLAREIIAGSNVLLGRTSNLLRILRRAHALPGAVVLGLVAAARQPSVGAVSDVRLRNLATIRTSMVKACDGVTRDAIEAFAGRFAAADATRRQHDDMTAAR